MNNMTTFTGKRFNPMEIAPENIELEDIAHALSLTCRGGGHLNYFYSVAQHSLNCAGEAKARGWSARMQLACLLHDASEAYISDIIRPVKAHLHNYLDIESMIMGKILDRFGLSDLTEEEHRMWREIDNEMLYLELSHLFRARRELPAPNLSSSPNLTERDWREVEQDFLRTARELISRL